MTSQVLKEAINRHLLYIIYLNQPNEQFNSINFVIINKWRRSSDQMHNVKHYGIKGEYKITKIEGKL